MVDAEQVIYIYVMHVISYNVHGQLYRYCNFHFKMKKSLRENTENKYVKNE